MGADGSSAADAIGEALGHLELQVGQLGEHVATGHGRVVVQERGLGVWRWCARASATRRMVLAVTAVSWSAGAGWDKVPADAVS
jgi:hypothetical protein